MAKIPKNMSLGLDKTISHMSEIYNLVLSIIDETNYNLLTS